MKNKVGLVIVTYTVNYGTYLQAFATQEAIRNLGYDTKILNIDSVISDVSKARKRYFIGQIFNLAEVKSYMGTIEAIIQKKINGRYRDYYYHREKCFDQFYDKYFDIGPVCDSWKGLSDYCKNFTSIVVGSDQLWRPANIAGNYYTLNFVPEEINKVAYATSFGLAEVRKKQRKNVEIFLNRIQHLSCREESGVKIIKSLTNRDASLVCDPTLLLKKDDWERYIEIKPIISGDYILTYLLSNNKEHRKYVKRLAKMTNCKIVGILHGAGYVRGDESFVDEYPKEIGPFQFLNLIKYAKFICTDSFHGCVFSTIFEKNYYAFKRFSDKDKMSTNSRVTNLLERFNLMNRLVEDYKKIDLSSINYSKVNARVNKFRNDSIDYLEQALRCKEEEV